MLFIQEPLKQSDILKAKQKIKGKGQTHTNTKTGLTTGMEGKELKFKSAKQGKKRHFYNAEIYQ